MAHGPYVMITGGGGDNWRCILLAHVFCLFLVVDIHSMGRSIAEIVDNRNIYVSTAKAGSLVSNSVERAA